jgi:NAD-dependent dihydropyrimidine dehydrogenase PreA subunit
MKSFLTSSDQRSMPRFDGADPNVAIGQVFVDDDKCSGCKLCVETCPGKALQLVGKTQVSMVSDAPVPCIACGDCVAICQPAAITLVKPHVYGGYFKSLHRGVTCMPRRF